MQIILIFTEKREIHCLVMQIVVTELIYLCSKVYIPLKNLHLFIIILTK